MSSSGAVWTNVGFDVAGSGGRGGEAMGVGLLLFGRVGVPIDGEAGTSRIVCSWNRPDVDGAVGVASFGPSSSSTRRLLLPTERMDAEV